MTNLERITAKIFGETATATGDDPQIGQFGSALAGTYVGTTNVDVIQSLPAWSNGFIDSVTPNEQFPPLPEMTGFGKVLSHQIAYTLQKGIPEWDSGTTYYKGDFAKGIGEGKLYVSKVNSNINNALTDSTYWEEFSSGALRNIGEIVASTIPLTDAGLHLLDGALLQYGSYQAFINYIADLYDSGDYDDIFETEANWQTAVTTYGVCGKFVYDSVNNTVRLPKITGILEGTTDVTALGDLIRAGLPNIAGRLACYDSFEIASATGPFYALPNTAGDPAAGGAGTPVDLGFDASRANPIYGRSNTVQPQTIKILYYIVIATTTKTEIEVDIDEIATDLNGKADVDLTNVNDSGTSLSAGWAMPSLTTRTAITIGASGATYTAPADGFLFLCANSGAGGGYMTAAQNQWADQRVYDKNYNNVYMTVQIAKGNYSINYGNVTFVFAYFVYAKGSENEASST